MNHLKANVRQNWCRNCDVKQALALRQSLQTPNEKLTDVVMILSQKTTFCSISRILTKHNITTIHVRIKNILVLRPKDKLGLKVAGIYCVPCECSKVYVGQTGRSIQTRCKEHEICLCQSEKSTVAEHRFETGHTIDFSSTPFYARPQVIWTTW